jgi:hypothetical protein
MISILQTISYELSANTYLSISKTLAMHPKLIKSMLNPVLRGDAPLKITIDAESSYAGQGSFWALDGVLKPVLKGEAHHPKVHILNCR